LTFVILLSISNRNVKLILKHNHVYFNFFSLINLKLKKKMFKNFIKKFPLNLCATIVCGTVIYKNFKDTNLKPHYAGYNYSRRFYPASSEYPEVTKHKNIMARNLTQNLYARLRDLRTPNGFTFFFKNKLDFYI
jgi:hypothetical protein